MVRPHSGSPRSKQRPFSDGYHSEHHGGRMGPSSRSQRGFRGHPGKAPPSWRESSSGGPYPYSKRPPLMGEPRERPHGHWMSQNQDHFRQYNSPQDSQRGRRRPSPPSANRAPPLQHRMSPHGPSHGPPGHHRPPPFNRNHSGHVSPSSRHFHGPPSDRRGLSPHSTYRAPPRHPSPAHEQERSWGPARYPSPRERPFMRQARGGHRWNGPGGYPHPNGEVRPSGSPYRKPREFHERSSYPERWSTEGDPRKPLGEVGRERGRDRPGYHTPEWVHREGGNSYPRPPYRSPSWKAGPPSSSDSSSRLPPPMRPQEKPSLKRRFQEFGRPPSMGMEYGPPKRFRRELSVRPLPPRGFGGRGLSLKDKSRLLKGRTFRAESVARFKLPPPRPSDKVQKTKVHKTAKNGEESSEDAPRKVPLKKSAKRPTTRESPTDTDSKSTDPERDSETQVESRRSVRAHSSSPIEKLTHDLVVVSHWEAETRPSSSPKSSPPWKNRASKHKTDASNSHGNLAPNERFGKLHVPGSSQHIPGSSLRDQKERRPATGPGKLLRKPGSFQKPSFRSGLGIKKGPCPDGVFRKPLMATIVARPPLHQKPVFRKSQSIMSKYKNLQTLRHKAPPHPRPTTSYRRW